MSELTPEKIEAIRKYCNWIYNRPEYQERLMNAILAEEESRACGGPVQYGVVSETGCETTLGEDTEESPEKDINPTN